MYFTGMAQAENFKIIPLEPANPTNVEESIQKLKSDDKSLKHLNLNNIKVRQRVLFLNLKSYLSS